MFAVHIAAAISALLMFIALSAWWSKTVAQPGARPGEAATVSLGGRLYDNHWAVVGRQPPSSWHPLFPKGIKTAPSDTWRCVSCHGWDYRGAEGHLGKVSTHSALKNLAGVVGQDPQKIRAYLESESHARVTAPLSPNLILALSKFLSYGQHNMMDYVDDGGKALGDPLRGKDIFGGVCERCHGPDGKAPIYGERGDKSSLGWIMRNRPEQAVHKIRNGVPIADMISLRFLESESLADLLAYLQELDRRQ